MTKTLHALFALMALTITLHAQPRYTEQSRLAKGKWVKICVDKEGVYQLTTGDLKGMGFGNAAKVALYGYNLPFLPETNIENLPDDLTEIPLYRKADGTLLFYSCGPTLWTRANANKPYTHRNNPYSTHIYYFLTESTNLPATFGKTEAEVSASTPQTTYYTHTLHEEDKFSFINAGRTFFEQHDYANGAQKSYSLNFDNACRGDISLAVQFGATCNESSTLTISTDNGTLGTLAFTKQSNYTEANIANGTYTLYDRTGTTQRITLKHNRPTGIAGHLDYLRASYTAELSLSGKNYVVFSPDGSGLKSFELKGATASTTVWDVTVPTSIHEVAGTLSANTYKGAFSQTKYTDRYVAVNTSASFPTPQVVGTVPNQNLHALSDIDLLIIVPANGRLTAQAQRLADAHAATDHLRCAVVEADKIYNEFSSGTPDATAYRRLAKMLYDKRGGLSSLSSTQAGSFNILLFGNAVWDNRLVTPSLASKSQDDYLLAYESENSWSHTDSYVLEEYFTLLADGKGVSPLKEMPDCGVGRLPVSTAAEAKNVVDKIIAYMTNTYAGAWKNTICMMGDDDKTNIHMEDAESIITNTERYFPDFHYKRIYWDSYDLKPTSTGKDCSALFADIDNTMQQGALIMNYTGHGAPYTLSHEKVLQTTHFQDWNSPRLPLWFTAACDVSPFDMNTENIGCEAVLNKQGGAIAFVGIARTVYSTPNRVLNRNFMQHVLDIKPNGQRYTLGEALAQAKADIIASKTSFSRIDSINKVHFVLLGDPALKLITPDYKVKVDKINGASPDPENPTTIAAGTNVTVEGRILDAQGHQATSFNGIISPTVYDSEQRIVCKLNSGVNISPYEYDDRTRILYAGTDSVVGGTFRFTFPVPLDINYSNLSGLITLYAIDNAKANEANGRFEDFLLGGSAQYESTDTEGPTIATYSNGHNVTDISYTNETPTLHIVLKDESGINTTGNGLGHDIVAIIDNNEATTFVLNDHYAQDIGDYRSGTVTYTLPTLAPGRHTLVVRAFDTLNNMGEEAYAFEVVEALAQIYDIYEPSGRKIHSSTDPSPSLPPGIYIRHTRLTSPKGDITTSAEKFIVTQ